MSQTDRELIREILKDHPGHSFWDGGKPKISTLNAREVQLLLSKDKEEVDHEKIIKVHTETRNPF